MGLMARANTQLMLVSINMAFATCMRHNRAGLFEASFPDIVRSVFAMLHLNVGGRRLQG